MSWGDANTIFLVVVNDEGQHSIWPSYKPMPAGWQEVGQRGSKAECLDWIDANWQDMRPKSLRAALQAAGAQDG
ncbi:MbtH family protein [Pseudoroseomonas cervicalis]|uniref:MbtH family protein n=1 Tax=Teichococcus cervicalis TaxID=204525 RepID=UPI002783966C|nr:MbtH family protein [Pseudoroseomonas cervicalis]MDQ1081781.1 MbtH protein [Pseudoroseomonas cervicalis]